MADLAFSQWWEYVLVVLLVFFTCLTLNYIVKRINEAHLEERLIRQGQKSPTSQSTQVQGPLIEIETRGSAAKVEPSLQMKENDKLRKSDDNVENIKTKFLGAIYESELSTSKNEQSTSKDGLGTSNSKDGLKTSKDERDTLKDAS